MDSIILIMVVCMYSRLHSTIFASVAVAGELLDDLSAEGRYSLQQLYKVVQHLSQGAGEVDCIALVVLEPGSADDVDR